MNESKIIEKFVLTETIQGYPMLVASYKVPNKNINSVHKQVLTNANAIRKTNEFLRSLNTGIEIKFKNYTQYTELIKSIAHKLNIPYIFSRQEI